MCSRHDDFSRGVEWEVSEGGFLFSLSWIKYEIRSPMTLGLLACFYFGFLEVYLFLHIAMISWKTLIFAMCKVFDVVKFFTTKENDTAEMNSWMILSFAM